MHRQTHDDEVQPDALLFPSATKKDKPVVEVRQSWETALKRAKIENFRFHDLRQTAASYLIMSDASAPEVTEVL